MITRLGPCVVVNPLTALRLEKEQVSEKAMRELPYVAKHIQSYHLNATKMMFHIGDNSMARVTLQYRHNAITLNVEIRWQRCGAKSYGNAMCQDYVHLRTRT